MKRRIRDSFLLGASFAALFALSGCGSEPPATKSAAATGASTKFNLLVGTYTEGTASSGKSKGIPVFRFDTTSGEVTHLADNDGIRNPSWLVVSSDAKRAYAVNELGGTGKSGEVSAFDFNPSTGRLLFINKVSSGGDDPCHLMLDEKQSALFVSNYTGGVMTVIPVSPKLAEALKIIPAPETSPVPDRSESHMHSTICLPGDAGLISQDLGLSTLTFIPFDNSPPLTNCVNPPPRKIITLPAGTGPRHLIFDTPGKYAYLVGETNDSVTVMKNTFSEADQRNEKAMPLTPVQTLTIGTPVAPGKGTAAAIHLSDDGRFLYASTRKPKNILVVFAVNPTDGTLREIQTVSSGGLAPREFTVAPGGKFLLVANQQSDAIAVFSRDTETGKITDTGRRIPVGSPTDLKWTPAK
jgi:6-phosphogluconolactonase